MEEKLAALGLRLPAPPPKGGVYKSVCISGNHLYASGHVPINYEGNKLEGRVGENMDTATAAKAAKLVGLNMLASIKAELGDLNKLKCLVDRKSVV